MKRRNTGYRCCCRCPCDDVATAVKTIISEAAIAAINTRLSFMISFFAVPGNGRSGGNRPAPACQALLRFGMSRHTPNAAARRAAARTTYPATASPANGAMTPPPVAIHLRRCTPLGLPLLIVAAYRHLAVRPVTCSASAHANVHWRNVSYGISGRMRNAAKAFRTPLVRTIVTARCVII